MKAPTFPERVQTLEDEVAGLESMIDARTRRLWKEIAGLKTQVAILQEKLKETKTCQS